VGGSKGEPLAPIPMAMLDALDGAALSLDNDIQNSKLRRNQLWRGRRFSKIAPLCWIRRNATWGIAATGVVNHRAGTAFNAVGWSTSYVLPPAQYIDQEMQMKKLLPVLIAAVFAATSAPLFAQPKEAQKEEQKQTTKKQTKKKKEAHKESKKKGKESMKESQKESQKESMKK